ncbi:universal stress protein [Acidiferrimicrobium sp. IK]|uniref:universal stress protein n=1 Tax=Acidiferrimicrobium sp. IK TaxID=2871700 RepID=UPI0021CB116A|nr:universal stress protein [Acidiferrimicrobium sp. IK]MCU4182879.1 universal stress protein [Acidiferrimicrobium sp. IK]
MTRTAMKGAVVVGVDGSAPSEAALRWACDEAARRKVDVVAVFVAPVFVPSEWGNVVAPPEAEGQRMLEDMVRRVPHDGVTVHRVVRVAPPVLSLRAEAVRHDASLLVVGRRGAGRLRRLVIGSVSAGLAQNPVRPLIIVPSIDGQPPAPLGPSSRILVGVDGSAPSLVALRWAAEEAERRDTTAEAVYAWSFPHLDLLPLLPPTHDNVTVLHARAKEALAHELAELPPRYRERVEPRLRKGDAAEVLLRLASKADLVVVGTRGQGFVRQHVLGSTSNAVLHHCKAALAVIPSGEHVDAGEHAGTDALGEPGALAGSDLAH